MNTIHPCQKPLILMKWCLSIFPHAQTILDPFMGSGTTLRAAKDLDRKAVGIEIEEKYCEIAAMRLDRCKTAMKHTELNPLFKL
jgi:DNA modification methylase